MKSALTSKLFSFKVLIWGGNEVREESTNQRGAFFYWSND